MKICSCLYNLLKMSLIFVHSSKSSILPQCTITTTHLFRWADAACIRSDHYLCDVRTTAHLPITCSEMIFQRWRLERGSIPELGSSWEVRGHMYSKKHVGCFSVLTEQKKNLMQNPHSPSKCNHAMHRAKILSQNNSYAKTLAKQHTNAFQRCL